MIYCENNFEYFLEKEFRLVYYEIKITKNCVIYFRSVIFDRVLIHFNLETYFLYQKLLELKSNWNFDWKLGIKFYQGNFGTLTPQGQLSLQGTFGV